MTLSSIPASLLRLAPAVALVPPSVTTAFVVTMAAPAARGLAALSTNRSAARRRTIDQSAAAVAPADQICVGHRLDQSAVGVMAVQARELSALSANQRASTGVLSTNHRAAAGVLSANHRAAATPAGGVTLVPARGMRNIRHKYGYKLDTSVPKVREDYGNANMPEKYKLPIQPRMPTIWSAAGVRIHRGTKELWRMYGEEHQHNRLRLQQFGIVALHGGVLKYQNFDMMRAMIGRKLEEGKSFAIYNIDAPYKPVTSKGVGKRLGGGKGPISHWVTPIRAGRVIFEVGGKVAWEEVQPWLNNVACLLPFSAIAVNQNILDTLNAEEKRLLDDDNLNPYSYEWLIRNNINDCQRRVSTYDKKWFGKFVYKDRTLNKKWNIVLRDHYTKKD